VTGRDIVCLSTHYWDERWFRKQEFMSRFARVNRVLYVEPSFSIARRPEPHLGEVATNRPVLSRLERRGDRLHVLKPPRGLPKWTQPTIERLNYAWYGRMIRRAMRQLGFADAVAWIYRPSYVHALPSIPHRNLVFDLVDDIAAYGSEAGVAHVERDVEELIRRSDLVLVTAKTLAERYGPEAKQLVQIPNGFDASLFSGGQRDVPADLEGLGRPLLGLVGTLFNFLDFDLLAAVARAFPSGTVVLVGPVEANARRDVDRLLETPNVVHLGARPKAQIPDYVVGFDVCLNPFRSGRAADSVNPLKVYEYLAAGRPVVSTPMKALQLEDAAAAIRFAEGAEAFCREIAQAVDEDRPELQHQRRAAVEGYSWDRLFDRLDAACDEALGSS
jgi:glycosyltransferase involved in cell wall biosynthesis